MAIVTLFKQRFLGNAATITLDKSQKVTVSHENEKRIFEIIKGLEPIKGCEIVDVESNESEVWHILLQCHSEEYINYIRTQSNILNINDSVCNDEYTEPGVEPETFIVKGIYKTALAAFCTSVQAAKHLNKNKKEFSYALTRPPGHHAGFAWMGGYCYFNNAAGAVFTLRENGHSRVGLIDLDYHFGNGSSDIFKNIPEVFFGSIHSSTLENFPYKKTFSQIDHQIFVPFSTPPSSKEYLLCTDKLINQAVSYGCSALVISVGYDIISGDPHGKWALQPDIYFDIGRILKKSSLPVCIIQEGGYNVNAIGKCAYNLVSGIVN